MNKKWNFQKICLWAGFCLIAAAAVALLGYQWSITAAGSRAEAYVQAMDSLIPTPQGAAVESRRDNTMPLLSLDGTDFVGILEMPAYDSRLVVCGTWGQPEKYPCRFGGSIYDSTMCIGATTQKGQYDFYREISVGDAISFTDVEGNRYAYTVADIRYEKHADQDALQSRNSPLTLFIKNVYATEYILLFCDIVS